MDNLGLFHVVSILIDVLGIIFGTVSFVIIVSAKRRLGGKINEAFSYVMFGIIFQTAAILFTLLSEKFALLPGDFEEIHHVVMSIGLLLFIFGAKKFSELSS